MSQTRASTPALVGHACFSLLLYAISERSVTPLHAEAYAKKLRAVSNMERSERAIAAWKR